MGSVYNSIIAGLTEAAEDTQYGSGKLKKRVVTIMPVQEYNSKQIHDIRKRTGLS